MEYESQVQGDPREFLRAFHTALAQAGFRVESPEESRVSASRRPRLSSAKQNLLAVFSEIEVACDGQSARVTGITKPYLVRFALYGAFMSLFLITVQWLALSPARDPLPEGIEFGNAEREALNDRFSHMPFLYGGGMAVVFLCLVPVIRVKAQNALRDLSDSLASLR